VDGFAEQGVGLVVIDLVQRVIVIGVIGCCFLSLAGETGADLFAADMVDELVFGGAEDIGFKGFDVCEAGAFFPDFEKYVLDDFFAGFFIAGEKEDVLGEGVEVLGIEGGEGGSVSFGQGLDECFLLVWGDGGQSKSLFVG